MSSAVKQFTGEPISHIKKQVLLVILVNDISDGVVDCNMLKAKLNFGEY